MAALDELVGGGGKKGNASFLGFNLAWNTNYHALRIMKLGARASGEKGEAGGN
jgi:hypothetical protein